MTPIRALSRRRLLGLLATLVVLAAVAVTAPWVWTTTAARGHLHDEATAPTADVAIVLGTEVAPDRRTPADRLAGRLTTAAALVKAGRARLILVSGDGNGASGDEPAVMKAYLITLGIDPDAVVADPYGLDTYDTCKRARSVHGVTEALVVTQSYHLSRAVTLCRHLGLDAEGVRARCDSCDLTGKRFRDFLASTKAAYDAVTDRPPAVVSPPSPIAR